MRVLIVDDEMVSRTKLELIMENYGECRTADHGDEALAAFHEAHWDGRPFDLIMLDINLPGMDGIQLLSAIRNAERKLDIDKPDRAKILMTSSYRDKDRIVASIRSGCDDYIGKPFDLNLLREKLANLGLKEQNASAAANAAGRAAPTTTDQLYSEIVEQINKNQTELPSLPKIYLRFRELMASKGSFKEIVGLLKKDIAITAEIIRRSNSAYYKGFVTNTLLEQAVARMGYEAIVQIVTELSFRKFFTMKVEKYRSLIENLWKHSISSAYAAEFITKLLKLDLKVDPFLMALLHDVGKLALLQIIADMENRGKFNDGIHPIMLVTILEDFHCQLGARLLEKWKFAEGYIYTTLNHDSPHPAAGKGLKAAKESEYGEELMVVQFANQLANWMGYDILASGPVEIDLIDALPFEHFDLQPERIADTREQVNERMQEAQVLF